MSQNPNYAAAGLVSDPFRPVPPTTFDNIIWAGNQEPYHAIRAAADSPAADVLGTSEFAVIMGEYGSGKTNALKYVGQELKKDGALVVYLGKFSVADKPNWHDVVKRIFGQAIHRAELEQRCTRLYEAVATEAQLRASASSDHGAVTLQQRLTAHQDEIAAEILPDLPGFANLLMDIGRNENSDIVDANWRYLTGQSDRRGNEKANKDYGVPADGLSTDYSASLLLSSFVKATTCQLPSLPPSKAFCMLFDELEGLGDLAPALQFSIKTGMRNLVDDCSDHLSLLCAATASDASEMWQILDEPLLSRLTREIIMLPQFDASDAARFLQDVLIAHRQTDFKHDGGNAWPFSEEGLEAFAQNCPQPITPRSLLLSARRLVFQEKLDSWKEGNNPITENDVLEFQAWANN